MAPYRSPGRRLGAGRPIGGVVPANQLALLREGFARLDARKAAEAAATTERDSADQTGA